MSTDAEEAPSFGGVGRLGSFSGGRRETGSLDKPASNDGGIFSGGRAETGSLDKTPSVEGPSFGSVQRNGVCTLANPISKSAVSSPHPSSNGEQAFGGSLRTTGGGAAKVPDAVKELEFDGAIGKAKAKDPLKDAVNRIGPLMDSLASVENEEKSVLLFELQQLLPQLQRAEVLLKSITRQLCSNLIHWPELLLGDTAETLMLLMKYSLPPGVRKVVCTSSFAVLKRDKIPLSFFETWGNVLMMALPEVTWKNEELKKIFLVLDCTSGDRVFLGKKLTARMLGFFAINEQIVKEHILSRAIVLAEDPDAEIRGMIAEGMEHIGSVIGSSIMEKDLWPALSHLFQDNDVRVSCAAVKSIAHIAQVHKVKAPSASFFKKLLPTVFLQICTNAQTYAAQDLRNLEDDCLLSLEIFSQTFGPLLASCFDALPAVETRKDMYRSYAAMCSANSPIIRRNCAFNLPGVAKTLVHRFRAEVSAVVEFLSKDADAETRWNLAAGLHETVKTLASRETVIVLYDAVYTLLQDPNSLVRLNALQHFNEIVSQLATQRGYAGASRMSPLFENLHLQCQGNWRTQELLTRQLGLAAPVVPPPTIESNILPLLFKLAAQSAFQVRKSSMVSLAACIRHLSDTFGRETAMQSFRNQWALSRVHWMRMGFIDAAEAAFDSYSRILFRDTFALELLRLARDPISNVRYRVAQVIAKVAPATHQMEEFHRAIKSLAEDPDVDVRDAVKGMEARVEQSLEEGVKTFEEDLDREDEEQNMYARHLEAQREANKKKSTVKETANKVLGKTKANASPVGATTGNGQGKNAPAAGTQGGSPSNLREAAVRKTDPTPKENRGFRSRQKKKLVNFVSPKKTKQ